MEEEGVREKSLIDPDSHQMGVSNNGTGIATICDGKIHYAKLTGDINFKQH